MTDKKVVELSSVQPRTKKGDSNAIKLATKLLERLESGEFTAFACVALRADGDTQTIIPATSEGRIKLIGALVLAQHELLKIIDGDD